MVNSISFPGLFDRVFEINRIAFTVFGKDIMWYGVILTTAVILAAVYGLQRCEEFGWSQDHLMDGLLWCLPAAIIGGAVGVLFGLLGKLGDKAAINAAGAYLSDAVYQLYRHLYHAAGANESYFSLGREDFGLGLAEADMKLSEQRYVRTLAACAGEKKAFPDLTPAALANEYPGRNQSLTQVLTTADKRVHQLAE